MKELGLRMFPYYGCGEVGYSGFDVKFSMLFCYNLFFFGYKWVYF